MKTTITFALLFALGIALVAWAGQRDTKYPEYCFDSYGEHYVCE